MLRHGDRVGAAIGAQRHAALAGRLEVGAVVARAQHLDELEVRRILEELRRHVLLDEAHEIVGTGQGGLLLRRIVQRLDDLVALGGQVVDHRQRVLGSDDEYAFNHNHSPQTTFSSFCNERRYFGTGVPGKVLGQLV